MEEEEVVCPWCFALISIGDAELKVCCCCKRIITEEDLIEAEVKEE